MCENTSRAVYTRGGGIINNSGGKEDSGKVRTNMCPCEPTNCHIHIEIAHGVSPIRCVASKARIHPRRYVQAPERVF